MTEQLTALEVCLATHDHTDPEVCSNAVAMRDLGATSEDGGKTISRPLTAEEIAQREADAAAFAAQQAEAEAAAAAKQAEKEAIASRLGLSLDELQTLLG